MLPLTKLPFAQSSSHDSGWLVESPMRDARQTEYWVEVGASGLAADEVKDGE